ncbi:hypothetical protein C0Z17_27970, partial [Trinickia caryophylli]
MRLVLCAFALGVVLLQQQPTLPGTLAWCLGAISFAALVAAGCAVDTLCRRRHPWGETSRGVLGAMRSAAPLAAFAAFAAAAALAGYGYAAWRADLRMRDALPEALEGRELVLVGHVRGLPVRERSHVRFVLAVDVEDARRRTGLPHFPRRGAGGRVAHRDSGCRAREFRLGSHARTSYRGRCVCVGDSSS